MPAPSGPRGARKRTFTARRELGGEQVEGRQAVRALKDAATG